MYIENILIIIGKVHVYNQITNPVTMKAIKYAAK